MSDSPLYSYMAPTMNGFVGVVQRSTDSAIIPLDAHNMDYVAFKNWVAAGNTPGGDTWPPPGGAP